MKNVITVIKGMALGMAFVIPGFSGQVPNCITKYTINNQICFFFNDISLYHFLSGFCIIVSINNPNIKVAIKC